jgi:imidazolonepropionase
MDPKNYLLTNIGQLNGILPQGKTCLKGTEMNHIESISNAYLRVEDGYISAFGPMEQCPQDEVAGRNLEGKWVMPGFVDSHTHMVFPSSRHNEYVMRLKGKSYAEIAAEGGGILNSAAKLQQTDSEVLFTQAYGYAMQAIACGTTALEIKSGYGLSVEAELKMLRVIKQLKQELSIPVKATFLGAHAFPAEYRQNHKGYIDLIIGEMLPRIAEEGLADFIDVFCDDGFYSVEETDLILSEGQKYGLRAKIHGNELGLTGGVQVAVKHDALSVDHLEHVGESEMECLLNSRTMPVALPGSSFFLKIPYTPARKMIDRGLPLAIASDFNPGSSPHYNLWFTWSLACLYNGMMPAEGFNALTINAAYALGIHETQGSITQGKKASLIITRPFESINEMPYWLTQNHALEVLI